MAATDNSPVQPTQFTGMGSFQHAEAVTASDTVDLVKISQVIYVGGTGNISLITASGETVLFTGVPAGTQLRVRATRIRATGTTATAMVSLY